MSWCHWMIRKRLRKILDLAFFFFLMSIFAMQVLALDRLIVRLYYNISQSTVVVKFLVV